MSFTKKQLYLITVFVVLSQCNSYRILGVFPYNGKSRNIVLQSVMKTLAKNGHQVDVVSHYPLKNPMENYHDVINLAGTVDNFINNLTVDFVQNVGGNIVFLAAESFGNKLCHLMGLEKFQKLIHNPPTDPPYDLVITEALGANCFVGLGYIFKVPVVAISPGVEFPWVSHYTGNTDNLAIVPYYYNVGIAKMDFWTRLRNVYTYFTQVKAFHSITEDSQTTSMRKYISPSVPNIREVEKNVALFLVNSHPVLAGVKPVTPSIVYIGGIHVESNNTLPQDLETWMDESSHGVVYFTFGSLVLIETLPTKTIKEIYTVFMNISPVRVLMRIVDSSQLPAGLPENVKVLPWIPQQAILAHRNTKAFITHGGLGGLIEALYFGVPMVGVPLGTDQFNNIASVVEKKMAVRIYLGKLSEKSLTSALNSILKNPIYKKNALFYSKVFRDQPISPEKKAVFWVEYVVRYGGDILKSPALEFSWVQLQLLDIYGFILLVLATVIGAGILTLKLLIKKFTNRSNKRDLRKKKS